MERWSGKVAVVTGASSGIGRQVVIDLISKGMVVAGLARRLEKLQDIKNCNDVNGLFHPVHCDVTNEEDILKAFKWVEANLGGVDVLINNAGLLYSEPKLIADTPTKVWKDILDTNIIGLSICTREALKTMKTRGDNGIIININSIGGHGIIKEYRHFPVAMYITSKHGVTIYTKCLREELSEAKSKIRVTSLSPGTVLTEMTDKMLTPEVQKMIPTLMPDDISNGVLYVLGQRPGTQIEELTITPTYH